MHSPEYLLGNQDIFQLSAKPLDEQKRIFVYFQEVIQGAETLEAEIKESLSPLAYKEAILDSLNEVKVFYNSFKEKFFNYL